jgi:fructose-specific phosphotransferase system IIA component
MVMGIQPAKLSELFSKDAIVLDLPAAGKQEVLESMLRHLERKGLVRDRNQALQDLVEREKVMSTGIGNGVAIPHAYTDGVDRLVAGFFRSTEGVDFDALDGKAVDLFFLILGPKANRREHIKVLAKVSRLLNHAEFREALRKVKDVEGVFSVFKSYGDR